MAEKRKLGCISMAEQEREALKAGTKSDRERIKEVTQVIHAPWDFYNQPEFIEWESLRPIFETQAKLWSKLIKTGVAKPFWEVANRLGLDPNKLFGTIQQQNDCAAWAAVRCYLARLLAQYQLGSEQAIEAINQMALYALSGGASNAGDYFPNNGRTLGSVALTACQTGLLPCRLVGDYDGRCRFTNKMAENKQEGKVRQCGWSEIRVDNINKTIEAVKIALKSFHPVLMGNTTALRDGTQQDENGIYVSSVGGGWGGGHATAILWYTEANDKSYYWIGNSHGLIYPSGDGAPAWGTYISEDSLKRYIDGDFADMYAITWTESPHGDDRTDLNLQR